MLTFPICGAIVRSSKESTFEKEKRKERKDMYNEFDAFGELFSQYNTYANKTSANGQKPVSLLKFALGQF